MITEKDIRIIQEYEDMHDILDFKPGKYSVPPEKLDEELEKVGMLKMYKKWDKHLKDYGFRFAYPMPVNLRTGALIYYLETELSVEGDHSQDCVVMYAYLTAEKVLFLYDSTKLNHYYTDYPIDLEAKLQKFYDKKFDYINFYPLNHKIEIKNIGYTTYFISEQCDMNYFRFDDFARLAISLDIEMQKRYPFLELHEYELFENAYLNRTLTGDGYIHPGFSQFSFECILGSFVGSSFKETREECLERAKGELYKLTEKNGELMQYLVDAVCKLEIMSDEEFRDMKYKVFDI